MTPQEKLHAVETAIRKALPRLLEPTEGCFMNLHYIDKKNKETVETCKIIGINKKGKLLVRYDDDEGYNILSKKGLDKYIKIGSYSILGHDILLTDVLEWLGLLKENNEDLFHCSLNEEIMRIDMDNKGRYEANMFKINISKPRLADQSEEIWEFLYKLIK